MASQPDKQPIAAPVPAPEEFVHSATAYSVSSEWVRGSHGLRFDATYYNPTLARALEMLRGSGMELRPLKDVTKRVFIPPRFKRVYVERKHGVPFLQGSHLVHFQPADLKYLSAKAHADMHRWIIRKGWVLVTCSGTIGRVAIAHDHWDGWAASQHILRIVPRTDDVAPPGYLYAFLLSFAGQAQLTSQIYGAVVDELTEGQAEGILVPVARTAGQRKAVQKINTSALAAIERHAEAVMLAEQSLSEVTGLLGLETA